MNLNDGDLNPALIIYSVENDCQNDKEINNESKKQCALQCRFYDEKKG